MAFIDLNPRASVPYIPHTRDITITYRLQEVDNYEPIMRLLVQIELHGNTKTKERTLSENIYT